MATTLEDKELTEQQELFCEYYATDTEFFGNGVKSYMKVYPDSSYAAARASASTFLTNPNILVRINELLEDMALNDAFVDKQIAMLITQNADWGAKMAAIKEYNALKSRITKKIEVSTPDEEDLEKIVKDITSDRDNLPDDSPRAEAEAGTDSPPSN
jgi:phage terminase small subunit